MLVAGYSSSGGPLPTTTGDIRSKPLPYPEFSRFLESRQQVPRVYGIHFQRDSVGSKLFINFNFRKGDEKVHRTLIITGSEIRDIPGHQKVWYDDHENPLFRLEGGREWYEGEGKSQRFFSRWDESSYILKSGVVIPYKELKSVSDMHGVVGGNFLLVRFRDKPAWIISAPENPSHALVELPQDLDHPQGSYARGRDLIFFGSWRPPKTGHIVKCLTYQPAADSYRLSEEVPIPWGGTVYDFDPKTGDALITGTGQFAGYYRYNIKTKKRARLGFAPSDDLLFLREDVIKTLDDALKESRKTSK